MGRQCFAISNVVKPTLLYQTNSYTDTVAMALRSSRYTPLVRDFVTYTGMGAIGTACQYTILVLLVQTIRVSPVTASTCGFVAGALINYILNYHITFRSAKRHAEALLKFYSVAIFGVTLNGLLMYIETKAYAMHYLLAQVIATALVLISNFLGNRFWTFKEKAPNSQS